MLLVAVLFLMETMFMGPSGPGKQWAPDLSALIESEKAFSRASIADGTREAYLSYVTNDGAAFRPLPVAGQRSLRELTSIPGVLSWEPAFAEVSIAGDLGYTTGPWRYEPEAGKVQGTDYGHYITLWRKQPNGSWRVVAGLGNVHGKPVARHDGVTYPDRHTGPRRQPTRPIHADEERAALLDADRALSRATTTHGVQNAFATFSTEDVRYYRNNQMPIVGSNAVRTALARARGSILGRATYADLASSGDLGYTYGVAMVRASDSGAPADSNAYLRVWRRGRDQRWKLALDIMTPTRH